MCTHTSRGALILILIPIPIPIDIDIEVDTPRGVEHVVSQSRQTDRERERDGGTQQLLLLQEDSTCKT